MRGEPLKMITAQRPLTEKEFDEAIEELLKRTNEIRRLMYYESPSEQRNRRNQQIKNRLKKRLVDENTKKENVYE